MIAMALSCKPKLLIADEPTTALDVTIQAQILELISLQAELGMALLLITHDLGVVAEIADEVAVMYAGRVVETGTVEEVLLRPSTPTRRACWSRSLARERGERLRSSRARCPTRSACRRLQVRAALPQRFEPCASHDPLLGDPDEMAVRAWPAGCGWTRRR